jgi:thioesterase domain-containing protein/acyl carrier protein
MIPDRIIKLSEIPITSNGKINYNEIYKLCNESIRIKNAENQLEELTEDEISIKHIFSQILKIESPGLNESFFDLGGNSLSAIELLFKINDNTKANLPLSFLFRNTTIKQIARELKKTSDFSNIVSIKKGNKKKTLFLIHPAGGNIFCYNTLSNLLEDDMSISGIQTTTAIINNDDIKSMAARYLGKIEELNIDGELIFGGWSMGALIAFEMALQFSEKNSLAYDVLIIDQMAYSNDPELDKMTGIDRIVQFAEKVEHMIGDRLNISKSKIEKLSDIELSALFLNKFQESGLVPKAMNINDFHGFLQQMIFHNEISSVYYPSHYKGKVIVVKSENPLLLTNYETIYTDKRPDDLLWGNFVETIEIIKTPGNHVSMMRSPFVEVLAQKISFVLGR